MRLMLLLLILLATPVWAEWTRVTENEEAIYYFDLATIRIDGNFRRVWEVQDGKVSEEEGDLSRRVWWEYDCNKKQSRLLSYSSYSGPMATGKLIESDNIASDWNRIPPKSAASEILQRVCAIPANSNAVPVAPLSTR